MAQPTQTRTIRIISDTSGAQGVKELAASMGLLNKSTKSLQTSMRNFSSLFQGVFAVSIFGVGISQITQMADSMQLLRDRIGILAGGTENVSGIMEGLLQRANKTKSSIEDLATTYARFSAATKETGISTENLLNLTETLQNTFRLSGASNREAYAASVQLSQGLASGVLRGEEFNSVLEQNVAIGDILSKSLNTTRGKLREMAKEGKLTASVVLKALFENMNSVNGQAAKLGQTFEQSVTVAMNKFRVTVDSINSTLGLNSKFATAMNFIVDRAGSIAAAFGLLSLSAIPALITGIRALTVASFAFLAANPLLAALGAVSVAIVAVGTDFDSLNEKIRRSRGNFQSFAADFEESGNSLRVKIAEALGMEGFAERIKKEGAATVASLRSTSEKIKQAELQTFRDAEDKYAKEQAKKKKDQEDFLKKLSANSIERDKTAKEVLATLNAEYAKGKITLKDYYSALDSQAVYKLNEQLKKGKIDLIAYNTQLAEIQKRDIYRSFQEGAISAKQLNDQLAALSQKSIAGRFEAGQISLQEMNTELAKLPNSLKTIDAISLGVNQYSDSIGTYAQAVANATASVLKSFEDEVVDFLTKGEATWENFASNIINQIARITYQMLIAKPIIESVMGMLVPGGSAAAGGGAASGLSGAQQMMPGFANGGAFNKSGVIPFAKGGVVNNASMFGFGKGKVGVMGEAGAEAIMPLRRGSDGKLGVQATPSSVIVNINNQSGGEVSQTESRGPSGERVLEITIQNAVKKGFNNGAFDTALSNQYGLRRRGT